MLLAFQKRKGCIIGLHSAQTLTGPELGLGASCLRTVASGLDAAISDYIHVAKATVGSGKLVVTFIVLARKWILCGACTSLPVLVRFISYMIAGDKLICLNPL